ncbi:PP2C family protein-serine/threonine phosphatase [Micromonospora krabiensis]|uniref:Serine phosphatase RsbU, regulator of sigma subunit n=1 Tax=Micromonospora krabiensis TaxID=307121 RepID=A0A1C3NBI8_9ACTN|nr:PP2C family protein-serine/threonine phosphatase [Micromonospora krabiensis]SBV29972.1 Serine phosphatase RsbU, regulator of sigma subunit [Micromonospora krabiensis]
MTATRRDGTADPVDDAAPHPPARRSAPADPGLTRELLDGLAEAVVTTDGAGLVTLVNAMAGELLPELRPGAELARSPVAALARAVRAGAGDFDGEHRGRRLRGARRDLTGGGHAWYVRDVTEECVRDDALLAERSRTSFLARAGSRLALSLDRDRTLRATVTLAVPYLADAAIVVHRPAPPATPVPRWHRYTDGDPDPVDGVASAELAAALPGLADALAGGPPSGPERWSPADLAALAPLLPTGFAPGAVLVSPMPGAAGPRATLLLVRRAGRAAFDGRDVELGHEFAARAGAALATAELYGEQTHLARVLQHSLLPPELPTLPGLAVAGGYRATGDSLRIGGDFYDVLPTGRGATFAIGDVSGRGVGAAVLTGRVRQSLRTLRLVEQRPRELLRLLNQALLDAPDAARRSQFTSLLLGTAEPLPGGGLRVRIAGGGHPAPLVLRADGVVRPVPVGGMPVGALPDARFVETEVRLAPGEVLLAHTDGVTRAYGDGPDGGPLGEARLSAALAGSAGLTAAALVDRLLRLVDEWLAGRGDDDVAMLALAPAEGD